MAHVDGAPHHLVEFRHERRRAIARELRVFALDVLGECSHELEVLGDRALDVVVQDLDDDLGSVVQGGRVNLRHRARTHRIGFERRERLLERRTELVDHKPAGDPGRIGWNRRSELFELLSDLGSDHVGSQAQHLSELRRTSSPARPRLAAFAHPE